MRIYWAYITAELVKNVMKKRPPFTDDALGEVWRLGYIAALQDTVDAFAAADKQPVAAE